MNISELQNNPPTDKNDYYTYIDYIDTQFHNVLTSASSDLVKNLQVTVPVKKPESISNPNDVKTYIDDVTKAINQQLVTVLRENNRFAKDFADLTQKIKKTRDSLKNNYDMIKTIT
jgi:flagellar hook-associated protein FlgK